MNQLKPFYLLILILIIINFKTLVLYIYIYIYIYSAIYIYIYIYIQEGNAVIAAQRAGITTANHLHAASSRYFLLQQQAFQLVSLLVISQQEQKYPKNCYPQRVSNQVCVSKIQCVMILYAFLSLITHTKSLATCNNIIVFQVGKFTKWRF